MPAHFYIRDAGAMSDDAQFIVDALDSAIPHLTAAGNAGQWGLLPFSRSSGFCRAIQEAIVESEKFRDRGLGERVRFFIAEVEDDASARTPDDGLARRVDELGKPYVAVGSVKLRDDHFARHVLTPHNLKPHVAAATAAGSFVYLDLLITDHRAGNMRKGAGSALIDRVKQYALENGKKTIWVDCWAGGTGGLLQYYQAMGFTPCANFEIPLVDHTMWQGTLFRMDVA